MCWRFDSFSKLSTTNISILIIYRLQGIVQLLLLKRCQYLWIFDDIFKSLSNLIPFHTFFTSVLLCKTKCFANQMCFIMWCNIPLFVRYNTFHSYSFWVFSWFSLPILFEERLLYCWCSYHWRLNYNRTNVQLLENY